MSPWVRIAVALVSLVAIGAALWDTPAYGWVMLPAALAGGWLVGGALHEIHRGLDADS